MKKTKLGRLSALLAASALLLGGMFMSCSSSDDDDSGTGGVQDNSTLADPVETTAPDTAGTITVTGGATYSGTSIDDAWAQVAAATANVTVTLTAGTYEASGQLAYSGAYDIKITGDTSAEYGTNVLIHGNMNTNAQNSRELLFLTKESTGNLTLEYITLKSDYAFTAASDVQSEVLATAGTGNVAAYNCSFLSGQDTIRTVAKAFFWGPLKTHWNLREAGDLIK